MPNRSCDNDPVATSERVVLELISFVLSFLIYTHCTHPSVPVNIIIIAIVQHSLPLRPQSARIRYLSHHPLISTHIRLVHIPRTHATHAPVMHTGWISRGRFAAGVLVEVQLRALFDSAMDGSATLSAPRARSALLAAPALCVAVRLQSPWGRIVGFFVAR